MSTQQNLFTECVSETIGGNPPDLEFKPEDFKALPFRGVLQHRVTWQDRGGIYRGRVRFNWGCLDRLPPFARFIEVYITHAPPGCKIWTGCNRCVDLHKILNVTR